MIRQIETKISKMSVAQQNTDWSVKENRRQTGGSFAYFNIERPEGEMASTGRQTEWTWLCWDCPSAEDTLSVLTNEFSRALRHYQVFRETTELTSTAQYGQIPHGWLLLDATSKHSKAVSWMHRLQMTHKELGVMLNMQGPYPGVVFCCSLKEAVCKAVEGNCWGKKGS